MDALRLDERFLRLSLIIDRPGIYRADAEDHYRGSDVPDEICLTQCLLVPPGWCMRIPSRAFTKSLASPRQV